MNNTAIVATVALLAALILARLVLLAWRNREPEPGTAAAVELEFRRAMARHNAARAAVARRIEANRRALMRPTRS